jgi:hypothetical protein
VRLERNRKKARSGPFSLFLLFSVWSDKKFLSIHQRRKRHEAKDFSKKSCNGFGIHLLSGISMGSLLDLCGGEARGTGTRGRKGDEHVPGEVLPF